MKNENILESRRTFLEDTIGFYNLNNRAQIAGPYGPLCVYGKTETSPGCAIGRHLPGELAEDLDGDVYSVFDKLPEWMRELGDDFLTQVQNLHDFDSNWTETGLSGAGLKEVKRIREGYL